MANERKYTIALVPAAGSGTRFGAPLNKVFADISGKPVLAWTLQAFEQSPEVDEIIPVFSSVDLDAGLKLIGRYGFTKIKQTAPGGAIRQESVFNALKMVVQKDSIVMIHDGARPLVSADIIRRAAASLDDCDGSVCAVSVNDTIKEVEGGFVVKTLVRDRLAAVQTPQTFAYDTVFNAYRRAFDDGLVFTDDTSVVEHYGGRIKIIDGHFSNLKITTKDDFIHAGAIFLAGQRQPAGRKP